MSRTVKFHYEWLFIKNFTIYFSTKILRLVKYSHWRIRDYFSRHSEIFIIPLRKLRTMLLFDLAFIVYLKTTSIFWAISPTCSIYSLCIQNCQISFWRCVENGKTRLLHKWLWWPNVAMSELSETMTMNLMLLDKIRTKERYCQWKE